MRVISRLIAFVGVRITGGDHLVPDFTRFGTSMADQGLEASSNFVAGSQDLRLIVGHRSYRSI